MIVFWHQGLYSLVVHMITMAAPLGYLLLYLLHAHAPDASLSAPLHHLIDDSAPAHPFDLLLHNLRHHHVPVVPLDAVPC